MVHAWRVLFFNITSTFFNQMPRWRWVLVSSTIVLKKKHQNQTLRVRCEGLFVASSCLYDTAAMETAAPMIARRCKSASSARTGLSEALVLKMNVSPIYGTFDVLQMKQWIIITAALLQAYLTSSSNLSSPSFPLPPPVLCSAAAASASIPPVLPFIPSPYHQTSSAAASFISSHFDSPRPLPAPLFSTCKTHLLTSIAPSSPAPLFSSSLWAGVSRSGCRCW